MKTPLELETEPQFKYRVRLLISYEGTNYCGWQSQLVHITKNSIQNILETALSKIFKEKITCTAAGRTDAGAHATSQNVHFEVSRDPRSIPILLALRTELPFSICARKAWLAPKNFSALSSARAKTYRYYVLNSESRSALNWRTTYWHPHPLNLVTLQAYAEQIIGRHDFKSFQSANGRPPKSSIRTIYKAQWLNPKKNILVFEITGNGFLTQMVRNLVGCQLDLHRKNKPPEELLRLLKAYDRKAIGKPAPASGLFLTKVHYPKTKLEQLEPLAIVRQSKNS
jgi:tRNA pseudouridine38-40 synthase